MDFYKMKRKKLQGLCKKHRIPANLKNIEMASRLASVFEKETEVDVSKVEKVPRGSKRHGNDINVLMDERPVKAVKGDEMQVLASYTRNSSRHDSFEAPIVVEKKRDRSAEPEMSQSAQLEQEEAGGDHLESRGSSKKSKKMNQECAKDKPQGMIDKSPSSSQTKAAESVMITENVLDSPPEKSVDISQRTITQELNSELMEGNHEEKLEGDTVFMDAIEDDNKEVSSCSVLSERSSPSSVQFAVSNPRAELGVPKDMASRVIAEENTKTKEETLICTPVSELKENSSVEAILENSTECWKEIHPDKDDEKCSFGKEVQPANLHGNFFEYNAENNSAVEEMEITKVGCVSVGQCVNLTPEKLLDEYTQLESEEGGGANVEAKGSSKKMKTVNQEFVKDKSQGMNEPVMISENVLDSTLKVSGDISPVRNTQELDSKPLQGECEKKHEQDTFLMAPIKEKEEASSLAVFLTNVSEVSNPEVELSVETTPPPASVQLAVSNPVAELGVPTSHILVKDIASTVIAKEDIKTKEEVHISIPTSELKEHSFVAKLAEAEANLENSAECCWNEIQSSKDSEKGSLEKTIQAENLHGNLSEYSTENSKVGCISVSHCVNLEKLDEVKAESLEKSEQRSSCESGCKLNASELRRCSSTHFTSHSLKENNVKCSEVDEIKALSLPLPRNNDASTFDELVIFTTLEKKLMLMEQISEKGKTLAVDSVTHHNDAEVECTRNEDNRTTENDVSDGAKNSGGNKAVTFYEESVVFSGPEGDLFGSFGQKAAAEFHDGYVAPNIPVRHPFPEDSELDEAAKGEENKPVELRVDSGIFTSAEKHLLLETDKGVKGDNITANSQVVSDVLAAAEHQSLMGDSEADETENKYAESFSAGKQEQKEVDDSVVQESYVAAPDFRENYIVDSSSSIASKVSYNHELNAGKETAGAELMPKDSQAEDDVGLDATKETSKISREQSPHVDSVNLFDLDIEEAETILEAERNVSVRSNVLALPSKGNSDNYLEVAGTCSMVSEESGPSTDNQNQINDVLEELAITDNNEADELIEAKVTKNIQMGFEGNLLLNSSSGSYVSGKTCILAGTANEDEAGVPIATTLEKAISLTSNELTVQNHMNEKDEEMITRGTTPIPEETMNSSPENRKEYLNIDESGPLSKRQTRRETIFITRTQVKLTRHDMKENAPNSKIVDNLNVTAPRTSKKKPLQDLSKN